MKSKDILALYIVSERVKLQSSLMAHDFAGFI